MNCVYASPNITYGEDGTYRWAYELNLYKNPTILLLIWKISGGTCVVIWAFMVLLAVFDDGFSLEALVFPTQFMLPFTLGFFALCLVGHLLYALIMGGKYCVLFEMDEYGVNHIQMEPQVKKAEAIGLLTTLAGLAAGRPGVVGTGMLAGARSSMYSSFDAVESVEAFPSRNLIKLNEMLFKNQVYAADEDFDFVLGFIRSHTNCR